MRITWLGHSAFRLEFGSSVVLIDPFLTGNPAFKGDPVEVTKGATHVVLSHGHGDHIGDTVAICEREGAKLVATYELCLWLNAKGVKAFDPMNTGGMTDQGEFTIALTQAFHSSAEVDSDGVFHNLGLPNGIVLTPKIAGEPTVYHCGDTDIFSDMALIQEIYEPQVAIMPIGDRFTMGAKTAALAAKRFLGKVGTIIPCHYATFPILDQGPEAFVKAMGNEAVRVKAPAVGETITV